MSTVTLRPDAQLFPAGTTVKAMAEPLRNTDSRLGGAPSGSVVAEATVAADGTLTFVGLAAGASYVGWAQVNGVDGYVRFQAPAASVLSPLRDVSTAGKTSAQITAALLPEVPQKGTAIYDSAGKQLLVYSGTKWFKQAFGLSEIA